VDLPEKDNLLAQPTRARLFSVLQELKRAASTEELANEVGLHVNGVRRQLGRMQDAGLIERTRSTHGRGRPRDEWSIAVGAAPSGRRPEAYADLSRWLARSIPPGPGRLRHLEATGREIGRELAPASTEDLAESFTQVFTALGFQPDVEIKGEGHLRCTLGNCPYRESVRENAEAICTLHKGMTQGLLDELDPAGRLARFEPHDPDNAGCMVEVTGAERVTVADADR
jgi:predicted ArsR family transcriptional regulator